jgi:ferredoxin
MAESWREAKEVAERQGLEHVYHDFDAGTCGACRADERQGTFARGVFREHRCIHMPASFTAEEMEEKEMKFLAENPGWRER